MSIWIGQEVFSSSNPIPNVSHKIFTLSLTQTQARKRKKGNKHDVDVKYFPSEVFFLLWLGVDEGIPKLKMRHVTQPTPTNGERKFLRPFFALSFSSFSLADKINRQPVEHSEKSFGVLIDLNFNSLATHKRFDPLSYWCATLNCELLRK